jgi:ubiquinone/menaquinone biosynthesis C-methylase UbiE
LDEINIFAKMKWKKYKVKILEFGCGSGRLLDNINLDNINLDYVWVDISNKLLDIAKNKFKKNKFKFICDDIINYVKWLEQESFDFVVWLASFQHIEKNKEKFLLMKNFYRILKYDWKLMMLNWSFSKWFIKKFRIQILNSFWKFIISFGKKDWKNIFIPRTDRNKVFHRFYHIYTIKELKKLVLMSWFLVRKLWYLDKKWNYINNWIDSKNSILIVEKNVFEN